MGLDNSLAVQPPMRSPMRSCRHWHYTRQGI